MKGGGQPFSHTLPTHLLMFCCCLNDDCDDSTHVSLLSDRFLIERTCYYLKALIQPTPTASTFPKHRLVLLLLFPCDGWSVKEPEEESRCGKILHRTSSCGNYHSQWQKFRRHLRGARLMPSFLEFLVQNFLCKKNVGFFVCLFVLLLFF